jgi:hypothetical protein
MGFFMYVDIRRELIQKNIILPDKGLNSKYKVLLSKYPELYNQLLSSTQFLKESSKDNTRERLYCIINNITELPQCQASDCTTPTQFIKDGVHRNHYHKFCSLKCSNNDGIVKQAKRQTSHDNWGVDNPSKSLIIQDRKKRTSQTKNGTDYPWQSIDSQVVLQDKQLLADMHNIQRLTLSEIGNLAKCDLSVVANYFKKYTIPVQHFTVSAAEREIVEWLTLIGVDNIDTNNRTKISPRELDIYLPNYNIAIEYCGLYWHSSKFKLPSYHKSKMTNCNAMGIRLITIFEDEWVHSKVLVKQKLSNILGKDQNSRIYARKGIVSIVPAQQKREFLNKYHIQGDGPGSISYALKYEDDIVAVMTFISQANGVYVLNRYATSTNVCGGFNKLLTHFKRNNNWTEIVSFADLRWSEGGVYKKSGFILDKILPPDYQYVINDTRVHKFNYRHKYLEQKLKVYDPTLSETQNTLNNGIYKIYNCGLQRWVLYNT